MRRVFVVAALLLLTACSPSSSYVKGEVVNITSYKKAGPGADFIPFTNEELEFLDTNDVTISPSARNKTKQNDKLNQHKIYQRQQHI